MKKIDFSKIEVKGIDGKPYMIPKMADGKTAFMEYDFSKALGNELFYGGQDIKIAEIGQKIYHHEEVEVSDEELATIREIIDSRFLPFVRMSVNPQLDKMVSE